MAVGVGQALGRGGGTSGDDLRLFGKCLENLQMSARTVKGLAGTGYVCDALLLRRLVGRGGCTYHSVTEYGISFIVWHYYDPCNTNRIIIGLYELDCDQTNAQE